jgi:hypothetical protein
MGRKKRWLIIPALLAVTAFMVYLALPRQQSLIDRSTRIAGFSRRGRSYAWQSDRAIIGFQWDAAGDELPVSVDTRTGVMMPVIKAANPKFADIISGCLVSPDGKRLLWYGYSTNIKEPWRILNLASGELFTPMQKLPKFAMYGGDDFAAWLPDSRHWAALVPDGSGADIFISSAETRTGAPGITIRVPLPNSPLSNASFANWYSYRLAGIAPNGHAIMTRWRPGKDCALDICDFALTPGATAKTTTLTWPAGVTTWEEVSLSPKADRFALIEHTGGYGKRPRWLERLFPPRFTMKLIVRKLDGMDRREIGSIVTDEAPSPMNDDAPSSLRWTPDGKKLSYIYKDYLYTVPAD